MPKGIYKVPVAVNEPIKSYASGSPERKELQAMLKELRSKKINIPMYIGDKEVESHVLVRLHPPHDHQHVLGHFHKSDKTHITQAIDAAFKLAVKSDTVKKFAAEKGSVILALSGDEAQAHVAKLSSIVSWTLFDGGTAKISPEKFGFPRLK